MSYSIVPDRENKDPRQLLYHFPSLPAQKYAKLVASFHNHQMLVLAQNIANIFGCIPVPSSCLDHRVRKKYKDKKCAVGKEVYYFLREEEIPKPSFRRFVEYVEDLKGECV